MIMIHILLYGRKVLYIGSFKFILNILVVCEENPWLGFSSVVSCKHVELNLYLDP